MLEAVAVLNDEIVVYVFGCVAEIGWTSVGDVLMSEIGEPRSIRRMEPEVVISMHAAHERILVHGGMCVRTMRPMPQRRPRPPGSSGQRSSASTA